MIMIIDVIGFLLSGELISALSCCNGVKNGSGCISQMSRGAGLGRNPPAPLFVILLGDGQTGRSSFIHFHTHIQETHIWTHLAMHVSHTGN